MEDVDHHVAEIQYHPAARRLAGVMFGAQAFLAGTARHFFGDGFQLRLGVARAENEVIRDGGNFSDVENQDIFGFFVQCRFAAEFG